MFRQLAANLLNGLRLATLRPATFIPSVGQLCGLLALGWCAAMVADWLLVEGAANVSPWGVSARAARSYWWLASVVGVLGICSALERRTHTFLPLAVALAAADLALWMARLGLSTLRLWFDDSTNAQLDEYAKWFFFTWQVAVFLRAWVVVLGGRARIALAVSMLYAGALFGALTLLPDYPIFEARNDAPSAQPINVENTYYRQAELLESAVSAINRGIPGHIDLNVVTFGGYGEEDVFIREVRQTSEILSGRFDSARRSVQLINNRASLTQQPLANAPNLAYVLGHFALRMDREEDILFLYMTSHGSESGEFAIELGELGLNSFRPEALRRILDESGIRWRVIVVSACYSGKFVEALASPSTLVISAAAQDKQSFGCAHENQWTYFGEAYIKEALGKTHSFKEAFELAQRAIAIREAREGKEPSLPQISVGSEIEIQLRHFEKQFEPVAEN
ncbi:MAG: hypothetical protein EXR86_15005 [Gammaproteobacteria bacterium]|nr:hypothetical protein [Gammaproteobacteria bacterium]